METEAEVSAEERLCLAVEAILARHLVHEAAPHQIRGDPEVRRPGSLMTGPRRHHQRATGELWRALRSLAAPLRVVLFAILALWIGLGLSLLWTSSMVLGLSLAYWLIRRQLAASSSSAGGGRRAHYASSTPAEIVLWLGNNLLLANTDSAVRALGSGFAARVEESSDSDAGPEDAQFALVWTGCLDDLPPDAANASPSPKEEEGGEEKKRRLGVWSTVRRLWRLAARLAAPGSLLTMVCALVVLSACTRLAEHCRGYDHPQTGMWRVWDAALHDLHQGHLL